MKPESCCTLAGVETIFSSRNIPKKVGVSITQLDSLNNLREVFNAFYIGIIPYCMTCKAPLRWHFEDPGKVIFSCDTCNRVWVKEKK